MLLLLVLLLLLLVLLLLLLVLLLLLLILPLFPLASLLLLLFLLGLLLCLLAGLFLLLLLVIGLLLQAGQHGAREGQIVGGVLLGRIGAQDLLIGGDGACEIAELEAGIPQVVLGRLRVGAMVRTLEGPGGVLVAPGTVECNAPAVGILERLGRPDVVARPEAVEGLLLAVLEESSLGARRREPQNDRQTGQPSRHFADLRRGRPRNWGRSRPTTASTGIQ